MHSSACGASPAGRRADRRARWHCRPSAIPLLDHDARKGVVSCAQSEKVERKPCTVTAVSRGVAGRRGQWADRLSKAIIKTVTGYF
jgi:hypothetical protein